MDASKEFARGFGKGKVVEHDTTDGDIQRYGARIVGADKVKARRVDWLWPGWIVKGGLTFLAGDPGIGKGVFIADLVGRLTSGCKFPDGAKPRRGSVLLYTIEENREAALIPRLRAAKADMARVKLVQPERFAPNGKEPAFQGLPEGIAHVEAFAIQLDASLVVFDPIVDFFAPKTDANDEAAVRNALKPLMMLAEDRNLAVLCVRHLNKKSEGQALYRMLGSTAFVQAPRSILFIAEKPGAADRRLLYSVKSNYGARPAALEFSLGRARNGSVAIEWHGESDEDPDMAAVGSGDLTGRKLAEAHAYLAKALISGEAEGEAVNRGARNLAISPKTLQRARKDMGITYRRDQNKKTGEFSGVIFVWSKQHRTEPRE